MEPAISTYQARAVQKYIRRSPRKLRLVADAVRGMRIDKALSTLKFMNKAGALDVEKVIRSAFGNLRDKFDEVAFEESEIILKTIMVDEGPTLKRIQPAPQGRAHPIRKRMSHITVVVSTIDDLNENSEV